jgi:nucleoside-diphosphate-sugar epimerase
MSASPTKVLMTGVQGLLAGAALAEFRREPGRYEVYGMDCRSDPWDYRQRVAGRALPQDRLRIADLSDIRAIRRAVEGMDVVLHFGADAAFGRGWQEEPAASIVGTYNIFEACREASVRRVVYGSSAMVCWGYLLEEPYRAIRERRYDDLPAALPMVTKSSPPRPSDREAVGKLWGEALGRAYSEAHGLSVLCLRFGWVNEQDSPWNPELASLWCSQRDAVQMVRRSVEASEDLRFGIFFGVSANSRRWVDTDDAADLMGYAALDRAEDHLDGSGKPLARVA